MVYGNKDKPIFSEKHLMNIRAFRHLMDQKLKDDKLNVMKSWMGTKVYYKSCVDRNRYLLVV